MKMWELLLVISGLAVCGLGQAWLFWDIDRQIKEYEKRLAEREQCPSLEEDERED